MWKRRQKNKDEFENIRVNLMANYLKVLLMIQCLFSACSADKPEIAIPSVEILPVTDTSTVLPIGGGNILLWPAGNMPATTSLQSVANSGNPDGPNFRPFMVHFPAKEGKAVKGAVLICAGGAFQFRGDNNEGTPVARALSELGYQSFVVNYRLRPSTQQEGALDLARAVRFVRFHSRDYGMEQEDIAVMGFSAGGILCGEMALNYKGIVNGLSLDPGYLPDSLDQVSADVSAIGHIYSFYGRLSVASTDVEKFRTSNLPPAFFCYGTRDPFVAQFGACVNALRQADLSVEVHILQDWPHGYGSRGDWIPLFDTWLVKHFM
jgi:acetyl esterase/lipase